MRKLTLEILVNLVQVMEVVLLGLKPRQRIVNAVALYVSEVKGITFLVTEIKGDLKIFNRAVICL
jgi:hypothetical protein